MEKLWRKEPSSLLETMESFKHNIWKWNKECFGNIFWRKKKCTTRLLGVQKALTEKYHNKSLYKLKERLRKELNDVLDQEEDY